MSGKEQSMAVQCSKCGEELLGAVNRCWKCGSTFAAPPISNNVPPIRRAPVPVVTQAQARFPASGGDLNALPAEVVGEAVLAETAGTALPATALPPGSLPSPSTVAASIPSRRRGSPFADGHIRGQSRPLPATVSQPARTYRPPADQARHSAAVGGAVASFLLGVFGLCGSYYIPIPALVTALVGVGMGLWGIYSERRGLAIAGLLLCCITLAVAGFFGAIELFTYINGYRPWEMNPALQTGPTTDF